MKKRKIIAIAFSISAIILIITILIISAHKSENAQQSHMQENTVLDAYTLENVGDFVAYYEEDGVNISSSLQRREFPPTISSNDRSPGPEEAVYCISGENVLKKDLDLNVRENYVYTVLDESSIVISREFKGYDDTNFTIQNCDTTNMTFDLFSSGSNSKTIHCVPYDMVDWKNCYNSTDRYGKEIFVIVLK